MNNFDLEKWIHRGTPLYITSVAVSMPMLFLPQNWLVRSISAVQLLVSLALLMLAIMHGDRFCEYCAAKSPLDGHAAAQKKRRSLRLYHRAFTRWGLLYLGAAIGLPMILPRFWPSTIASLATMPGLMLFMWALRVHSFLKVWCPWCDHGRGDGDGLLEPEPGPSHGIPIPVAQGQR